MKCGLRSCTFHIPFLFSHAYASSSSSFSTQKLCPYVSSESGGGSSPLLRSIRVKEEGPFTKIPPCNRRRCLPAHVLLRLPPPPPHNGFSPPSQSHAHSVSFPHAHSQAHSPGEKEERALINESCPQRGNLLLPRFSSLLSFAICKQQHSFLCRVTRG